MEPRIVKAAFSIDSWDENAYDEPDQGPKLTRVTISKTYSGAIVGTSQTTVLTAQGPGGSGYLASERVVGSVEGRDGSFVIQHGGRVNGVGEQHTFGAVVDGSGTGELAGIAGRAVEAEHEVLTLELTSW